MSLTPTLLHRPSQKFFPSHPPELKSINSTFFVDSSSSKLSPFGGFVSKKGFFDKNCVLGPNNMFKLNKPCALKGDDGDKGVKVLQQEAFDNGSSKFGQEFLDDGLEATLNRLVGISRLSQSNQGFSF